MSKFYTFVGELDNALYQRYYDENKKEVFEKIENYDYTLYAEHQTGDGVYKTLDNKNLKEIRFDNPKDLKAFHRENKDYMRIHGNDSPVHQFISKEYNFDVNQTCDVSILNFDIEVEHGDGLKKYSDNHQVKVRLKS